MLTPENLIGVVLDERYQILSLEEQIGALTLYKARHQLMGRQVLVKILPAELVESKAQLEQFRQTAIELCSLDHPAIVCIRDFGLYAGSNPYLVVDFIEGKTIAELIRAQGPIPAKQTIELALQVCDALEYLLSKGRQPPAISPETMIVETADGNYNRIKIRLNELAGSFDATDSNALESSRYLSPEQCMGRPLDARSAVYSLGCVLCECLSGTPPFTGDDINEITQQHISVSSPTLTDLSKSTRASRELIAIVSKAMSKSPKARYQSLAELKTALKEHVPPEAHANSARANLKIALAAGIVTFVLLFAALAAWLLFTPAGRLQGGKVSLALSEVAGTPTSINQRQNLAKQAIESGDYAQAKVYYLSLIPALEQKYGAISEEVADALDQLGDVSRKLGDVEEADTCCITAANRYKDLAIAGAQSRNSPLIFRLRSKEAAVLAKCKGKTERERSDALLCAASIAEQLHQYAVAGELLKQKIALDHQCASIAKSPKARMKWQANEAFGMTRMASILVHERLLESAEKLYLEAVELSKKSAGPVEQSYAYNGLAHLYSERRQYDKAEENLKECLALRHSVLRADDPIVAMTEWDLVQVYKAMRQYSLAAQYMHDFLQHYRIKGGLVTQDHLAIYKELQEQAMHKGK
jgi:tetratricopeptide (TPR) repeat protein